MPRSIRQMKQVKLTPQRSTSVSRYKINLFKNVKKVKSKTNLNPTPNKRPR